MFGSGLEVVCVIVTRTVIKWFKGYELALALAINMGFGRLGSALGTSLSIDIAQGSVPTAIGFASTLVGLGFILFLIYFVFDLKLDKQLNEQTEKIADEQFKFSDLVKLITNKSFLYIALLCVAFYSAVFPFMQYAPDLLVNKYGFGYLIPESAEVFKIFGSEMLGTISIYLGLFVFGLTFSMVPSKMKTRRNQVLSVTIILALFSLFIYSLWDSTLSVWLENGPKTASLIPLGTILFTPIFGNFVDKKGKAASLMILGACLLIFAHLSLSIFDSKLLGYAGLVSLGIAFSLVPAAMWPSVAKIVAENRLGTAYASMFTIQNWGLGIFFWGIGAVLNIFNSETVEQIASIKEGFVAQGLTNVQIGEKMIELKAAGEIPAYDYTNPILMLVVLGCISIVLAFLLKKADKEQGYGLEKPNIVE
jgi:MFS family permease